MEILNFINKMGPYEATASVLVVIGVGLISIPNFYGQIVMLFGQLCWIAHGISTSQPGLLAQSFILLILNIIAIQNWHKKGVGYKHIKRDCLSDVKASKEAIEDLHRRSQ